MHNLILIYGSPYFLLLKVLQQKFIQINPLFFWEFCKNISQSSISYKRKEVQAHIPEVYLHIRVTCLGEYNIVLDKQINTASEG